MESDAKLAISATPTWDDSRETRERIEAFDSRRSRAGWVSNSEALFVLDKTREELSWRIHIQGVNYANWRLEQNKTGAIERLARKLLTEGPSEYAMVHASQLLTILGVEL